MSKSALPNANHDVNKGPSCRQNDEVPTVANMLSCLRVFVIREKMGLNKLAKVFFQMLIAV